jgi:Zn-dependent protease with chaperone function
MGASRAPLGGRGRGCYSASVEPTSPPPARFEDPAGGFFAKQGRRRVGVEVVAALALLGGLVAGATAAVAPLTDAVVAALPRAVDRKIGGLAAKVMRAGEGGEVPAAARERVARVLAELEAALSPEERAAIGTATVTVQRDDAVNAFALPDGSLFVNTGLLEAPEATDDALRGVLAHELGHVLHRHGMRQLVRSQLLALALAWTTGGLENLEALLVDGSASLLSLAYSRAMEEESDDLALALAARAGWSTEGLARFFEAMPEAGPEALSTHPEPAARAARIRARAAGR